MRDIRGWVGILTGASMGLGRHMAGVLADAGVRLALIARSRPELEDLAEELRDAGHQAVAIPADLTEEATFDPVLERVTTELGPPDLLINNAGVGVTHRYHTLPEARIHLILQLNLVTPMILSRRVLPGMVERGRGHILNIASLAGHAYPPYHEGYAATKAGLIGFTRSLRGELRGTGVSASLVSPGFVRGAGMFERAAAESAVDAPSTVGAVTPDAVSAAVLESIRRDRVEILVAPLGTRVLIRGLAPFPRLADWALQRLGVTDLYRRRAEANERHAAPD